ncbi:MAG: hypothetical protein AAGA60_23485 [Cyanobacteria bacterium P01_E01_bin.42]
MRRGYCGRERQSRSLLSLLQQYWESTIRGNHDRSSFNEESDRFILYAL